MDSKINDTYIVNSLDRGVGALSSFISVPEMSFTTFVKTTGLNKTTAKRILYTLESNELIKFNPSRNTYSLGIRVFELGNVAAENLPLLRISRPYMDSLCNEINETVILSQRVGYEQLYLYKIEGEGTVHLPTLTGHRRPLYYGLGKTILAHLSEEELAYCMPDNLPSYSRKTISEGEHFRDELKKIKQQGYAIDDEEYIEGVVGIGFPIFSGKQEAYGVFGVVGPATRMTCEKKNYVVRLLKKVSQAISLKFRDCLGGE